MNKSCQLDELKTQTTLPARKIFKRQSKFNSNSLSSSRKSLSSRKLDQQLSMPFIKMNFNHSQSFCKAFKFNFINNKTLGDNLSQNSKQQTAKLVSNRTLNDKSLKKQKQLASKVQELLEQTIMRQQELNQMMIEKQCMSLELESLKNKTKILEQSNAQLRKSEYQLKDSLKKMTRQRNLLQSQKLSLTKKISEMEKQAFPSKNVSLQNMKQLYLQKQLLQLRHKFSKQRTNNEKSLQNEVTDLTQKLFNSNKLVDSLRITNQCLLMKNQSIIKQLKSTPQLMGLRTKYKKILQQRDQLKRTKQTSKKQIDNLLKENNTIIRQLQRLKTLPLSLGEESLNFSMMSVLSQK